MRPAKRIDPRVQPTPTVTAMSNPAEAPQCDLVLEGGVTSAVVYMSFIRSLAQRYRFRQLGGASSGAAAAAAAAIAQRSKIEIGGQPAGQPPKDPFDGLLEFIDEVAKPGALGPTRLFDLFQAQPKNVRAHRILCVWLKHRLNGARLRVLWATLREFYAASLIGALVGGLLLWPGWKWFQAQPSWWQPLWALFGLGLIGLMAVLCAVFWALLTTLRGLRDNHFGLCSGMRGPEYSDDRGALTPSLHRLYNGLLNRTPAQDPVVFGNLWGADPERREIDLQVISTALHLQRPVRIPGDLGSDALAGFYYDPNEWAALFPLSVLDWMRRNARPASGPRVFAAPTTSALARAERGAPLLPLPPARALPVLVAVRMSIAFPGLLSAIPLYTVDGKRGLRISPARPDGRAAEAWFIAEKVYFADGGITSNCPIHLFDAPLPRRPTFAMRLGQVEPDQTPRSRVWLHGQRRPAPARVRPVVRGGALDAMLAFVTQIVMTPIAWRDQVQSELPGYRERIVTVDLKPDEGGLNLLMPAKTIRRLARYGRVAALRLHAAYGTRSSARPSNAWDDHRWLRIRSTLAAAQRYLRDMQRMDKHERAALRALFDQSPALDPRLADRDALAHALALFGGLPALDPALDPLNLTPAPDFEAPDLGINQPEPAPRLRMSAPL